MAKNYTISFISLRAGTVYTVNIGGGSGAAVPLKGGSQPFVTQEDASEDMFTTIRTQSGYLRIVDDGLDANGNAFDWKDLIPATDTSRPVTLTHQSGGATVIDWQGFMQAQTFSGVLYGNPQEREFPVQCVLSVLSSTQVSTSETVYRNFAYVLNTIFTTLPQSLQPTYIYIQGGADALGWLRKKIDWRNYLNINGGDVTPQYNYYDILEDICRFWGWTARTYQQTVLLTAVDDAAEQNVLILTMAQLASIASGTTGAIGTVETMLSTATLPDFASTDNDEMTVRGYSKVVVNADCNKSDSELKFAPQSFEIEMEEGGYTWVGDTDNGRIGYFTTPERTIFMSGGYRVMDGQAISTYAGFARRQIYSEADQTTPSIVDEIVLRGPASTAFKAYIESTYEMSFPGGSFTIKGNIYEGWEQTTKKMTGENEEMRRMRIAIGIGPSRSSNQTRWLKFANQTVGDTTVQWTTDKNIVDVMVKNAPTLCVIKYVHISPITWMNWLNAIPVPSDLSGRVFVEFYGSPDVDYQRIGNPGECNFEIADFTLTFSRDAVSITGNRERSAIRTRYSSRDYTATNQSQASETQNIDCIYASDNEMDYGYGLIMNADGSFMVTAAYGNSNEQPEQHLANRIAAFANKSRRVFALELQGSAVITPRKSASVDGTISYPVAISHDWYDDVTQLTMIEL